MTVRQVFHFDGGCRPNPGPMEIAVVHRGVVHLRTGLGNGDNNDAEWCALLFAVDLAIAGKADDVLFIGDSAVVVGQASGRTRCRSPHLAGYLETFVANSAVFARVRLRLVPRAKNLAGIALATRFRERNTGSATSVNDSAP